MRTFPITLGVALLVGCGTHQVPVKTTEKPVLVGTAEDDTLYRKRFAALRDRTGTNGLAAYDPLKSVPGAILQTPVQSNSSLISDDALDSINQYAESMNSLALMVWQDGNLVVETYFGDTDRQSLIVSKSLAKPLSVIAVGRALHEGFISSLDDPVADYIVEWQSTPKAAITIRQLLGMRAGLLPQGMAPDVTDVLNRAYLHPRHDEVIVQEYPLTHEPGSRYEYSNASSELVAVLIERATNVQYEDWVGTEVLRLIGAPGGQVWMNRPEGTAHSGCCWLLPAESWLRMAILLMHDGEADGQRILPVGFVGEMQRTFEQNPHAGLGVYVAGHYLERRGPLNPELAIGQNWHSEPYLADDLFLFDGNSNQVVYIIPSANLIIARFGNWPPKDPEWDNAFLPNTILRDLPPVITDSLTPQPRLAD